MSNTKISALTSASTPLTGTEVVPLVQSGVTYKVSVTNLLYAPNLSGTSLPSAIVTSSLTSVGTIGTGVWQGTTVSTGYGGTGLTSFTSGGIVYASSTSALATSSGLTFDGTDLKPGGKILGQASSGAILQLGVGTTSYVVIDGGVAAFYPTTDNTTSLGYSTRRWTTVYATTPLINTSDANDKQDIADLTDAEIATAKVIKRLFKSFKFKEAVAKKGANARTHIGVIAQDVQAAFAANGLDAAKYGIFCSDTWYEVDGSPTDENDIHYTSSTPNAVEVTKLGIRYGELFAFVIASM
jgi:hypothetical protein